MVMDAGDIHLFLLSIFIILLNVSALCLAVFLVYIWMNIDIDIENKIPVEEMIDNGTKSTVCNVNQIDDP